MGTSTIETTYRCSDDCRMEGCPGHSGRLYHQSTADAYTFDMDGRILHFERGELEAMVGMLRDLGRHRLDAIQIAPPSTEGGEDGSC